MKRWLSFVLSNVILVLLVVDVQPGLAQQTTCPGALAPRLTPGKYAYVLPIPPMPVSVRTQAGKSGRVFATLAPGTQFTVMDGPVCANGSWWWHVRNNQYQVTGWLMEGEKSSYYVGPVTDAGSADIAPATNGPVGEIAFVGLTDIDASGYGIYDIYLTNGDGSHRIQLTNSVHTDDFSAPPAWSPDGKQIVLEGSLNQIPGLYAINVDGSNLYYIGGGYSDPSWFPDGKRLLVNAYFQDKTRIYIINTKGKPLVDVTPVLENSGVRCPTLSPDGKQVAFAASDANHPDSLLPWVYIMDIASSQLVTMGNSGAGYSSYHYGGMGCPAWSPDGKRIAFTRTKKGTSGGTIFVANVDGSGPSPVFETTQNYGYGSLAWSPDGAYIVYSVMTTPNKPDVPNDWTLAVIPVGTNMNDSNTKPVYIAKGMDAVWKPTHSAS